MNNILSKILPVFVAAACFTSCNKDLDLQPLNSQISDVQYATPAGYKNVLAKVYGSYSLTSNSGVGVSDVNVSGLSDPGTADFIRAYWNLQELTTDEGICAWNDANLQSFHNLNWTSSNVLINFLYARSLFQITVCNEFIRESADDKLSGRGIKGTDADDIRHYRAEARFLRAYQYWVLMDLFQNPPFVTEKDPVGKFIPPQIKRADLFAYIESELKDIDGSLPAPHSLAYSRVTQAAAWSLLARMYLNAEVYLGAGKGKYTEAITYSSKVISAGFTLMPNFTNLFKSDNDLNNPEVILSINYDATYSQNYGGTTFLICSAHDNSPANNKNYGIPAGGWLGNRSTKNLPGLFPEGDKRAQFVGNKADIDDVLSFTDGLSVFKFSNLTSTGTTPYSPNGVLCSTDFPLFRLAEMYLTYAEAVKRGGTGGDDATAVGYINKLRERAYGNQTGNITSYSLDNMLDERGRELYWECFRRTDLIRFGKFTADNYLWPWKGGAKTGRGVDARFTTFPIPAAEIISNPNLVQNAGY